MDLIKKFLMPTQSKLIIFVVLFLVFTFLQSYLASQTTQPGSQVIYGVPAVFYRGECAVGTLNYCTSGFYPLALVQNLIVFYFLACLLKIKT